MPQRNTDAPGSPNRQLPKFLVEGNAVGQRRTTRYLGSCWHKSEWCISTGCTTELTVPSSANKNNTQKTRKREDMIHKK